MEEVAPVVLNRHARVAITSQSVVQVAAPRRDESQESSKCLPGIRQRNPRSPLGPSDLLVPAQIFSPGPRNWGPASLWSLENDETIQ